MVNLDPDSNAQVLRLGNIVPDFKAETTKGPIQWHKWIENSWAVSWNPLVCDPNNFAVSNKFCCSNQTGPFSGSLTDWGIPTCRSCSPTPLTSHPFVSPCLGNDKTTDSVMPWELADAFKQCQGYKEKDPEQLKRSHVLQEKLVWCSVEDVTWKYECRHDRDWSACTEVSILPLKYCQNVF